MRNAGIDEIRRGEHRGFHRGADRDDGDREVLAFLVRHHPRQAGIGVHDLEDLSEIGLGDPRVLLQGGDAMAQTVQFDRRRRPEAAQPDDQDVLLFLAHLPAVPSRSWRPDLGRAMTR